MTEAGPPTRLESALRDYYSDLEPGTGPGQRWKDYALSADARGAALIETLTNVMPDLQGRRHLDIGCGYGGVCVAAAEAGATTIGIEIDERLLRLAELNQVDRPDLDLRFYQMDALDWAQLSSLGTFDAITADNVIEHVAVPEQLVAHIARLLKPGGVAYVTVPNAFSVGQVKADCHFGLFAASLLDTWDAGEYLRTALGLPKYGVSAYFPFDVYAGFFAKEGLVTELLIDDEFAEVDRRFLAGELAGLLPTLEETIDSGAVPDSLQGKLRWVVTEYVKRGEAALSAYGRAPAAARARLGRHLRRDYLSEVWYFMASDDPRALRYKGTRGWARLSSAARARLHRLSGDKQ